MIKKRPFGKKKEYFQVCYYCDAHLDPDEVCTCSKNQDLYALEIKKREEKEDVE